MVSNAPLQVCRPVPWSIHCSVWAKLSYRRAVPRYPLTPQVRRIQVGQQSYAGWWWLNHLEKYESQWEGLSIHIMENKKVWNHQPDMMMLRGGVNHDKLFLHIATSSTCHVIKLTGWWHEYIPPMIHDVGTLKKYCLFYSMICAASMRSAKIYVRNSAAHARRAMLNAQQWHHGIQALICRDPSAKFGGCFG